MPRPRKVSSLVREACLNSTIHGVKYFYIFPGKYSRIFWLFNVIILVVLASYLTIDLYNRFIELPTRISIENQFAPLSEVPFPAVTICPPNQLSKTRVQHFRETLIDKAYSTTDEDIDKAIPMLTGFYRQIPYNETLLRNLHKTMELNRHQISQVMMKLPIQCSDFLKKCLWEGVMLPCTFIFTPILTSDGYCCTYNNIFAHNGKIDYETFVPTYPEFYGDGFGLSILYDYNLKDVLNGTLFNSGATQVMIHEYNEFPTSFERTLIPPGVEAFIGIEASSINASDDVRILDAQSRNCVFKHEANLNFFRDYHDTNCNVECYANKTYQLCECIEAHLLWTRGHRRCQAKDIPCLIKSRRLIANNSFDFVKCNCPRQCSGFIYKIDAYNGNLMAMQYVLDDMYREMKVEQRSDTSMLQIYFKFPYYIKQKQETITSTTVILSNLGGVFGLCLGCSAISIVEIIYYTIKIIIYKVKFYIRNKRNAKKVKRTNIVKSFIQ